MPTKHRTTAETRRETGPNRWLVIEYVPTSLFSLKMSAASSGVGKTLLVPTPYAVKMGLIDAALRSGWDGDPKALVEGLSGTDVRIGVPLQVTVTHTIVKIRQEPKKKAVGVAYTSAVAYREFVYYGGSLCWAFDRSTMSDRLEQAVIWLAPAVQYIGKRGGFIQFINAEQRESLSLDFTQPLETGDLRISPYLHLATLDDFGPEANLGALNSYSDIPIRRDKHRKFVQTLVPLGVVSVGPGFTEYRSGALEEV